jgi:hypothetical protein
LYVAAEGEQDADTQDEVPQDITIQDEVTAAGRQIAFLSFFKTRCFTIITALFSPTYCFFQEIEKKLQINEKRGKIF